MNDQKAPIFFPIDLDQFWEKIRELVRMELQNTQQPADTAIACSVPGMVQKPVYRANEVCALLQISRQTLHCWVRDGIVRQYKIKSRTFFLWTDIEKLISPKPSPEQV